MNVLKILLYCSFAVLLLMFLSSGLVSAQSKTEVLTGDALKLAVPTSFYFAGQSAETQIRNAAAVKFGDNRYVIVGLVDTSGYSTEISGKYEGFIITDSPVKIGDGELGVGAYGFGFTKEGKINIFDLSASQILSAATKTDSELKRPKPLSLAADANGVRFYRGKAYVQVSPK